MQDPKSSWKLYNVVTEHFATMEDGGIQIPPLYFSLLAVVFLVVIWIIFSKHVPVIPFIPPLVAFCVFLVIKKNWQAVWDWQDQKQVFPVYFPVMFSLVLSNYKNSMLHFSQSLFWLSIQFFISSCFYCLHPGWPLPYLFNLELFLPLFNSIMCNA